MGGLIFEVKLLPKEGFFVLIVIGFALDRSILSPQQGKS